MRFAFLGSGSRGNAILFESGRTRMLVDCGFSAAQMQRRLARLDVAPETLTGILVTHEHSDHVLGLERFAGRHGLPVWLTPGTLAALPQPALPGIELFSPHESFAVDDLEVLPFPVPHDAREPAQFVISDGDRRAALLSDLGHVTPHVRAHVAGCEALVLECNHDADMLAAGRYPAFLKRRVSGRLGHLSNAQAADLLAELDAGELQHVVAAHLSGQNNTRDLARGALATALGCREDWIDVADQEQGLEWRTIRTR